jgi:citrate lyase subunit beta / citryl-CoA lyase
MFQRSYLFLPADRPERYSKAIAAGADAVIIDLEEAVAQLAEDEARRQLLSGWPSAPAQAQTVDTRVLIRVNGTDSGWLEEDLAL